MLHRCEFTINERSTLYYQNILKMKTENVKFNRNLMLRQQMKKRQRQYIELDVHYWEKKAAASRKSQSLKTAVETKGDSNANKFMFPDDLEATFHKGKLTNALKSATKESHMRNNGEKRPENNAQVVPLASKSECDSIMQSTVTKSLQEPMSQTIPRDKDILTSNGERTGCKKEQQHTCLDEEMIPSSVSNDDDTAMLSHLPDIVARMKGIRKRTATREQPVHKKRVHFADDVEMVSHSPSEAVDHSLSPVLSVNKISPHIFPNIYTRNMQHHSESTESCIMDKNFEAQVDIVKLGVHHISNAQTSDHPKAIAKDEVTPDHAKTSSVTDELRENKQEELQEEEDFSDPPFPLSQVRSASSRKICDQLLDADHEVPDSSSQCSLVESSQLEQCLHLDDCELKPPKRKSFWLN